MELSCKSCLAKLFLKLLHRAVLQKLPYKAISQAFVWNCDAEVEVAFAKLFLKLLCESVVQELLLELVLKLLYGTVMQKLPCVKTCSVFPGSCDVLLNNGRGLVRRLSYVGRNQIRLFMVHDTAWNCRA